MPKIKCFNIYAFTQKRFLKKHRTYNWDLGMSDRADPNCPVLNHHLVSRLEIVLFYIVGFRYILSCP